MEKPNQTAETEQDCANEFSGYSLPTQAGLSGYSLPSQAGLSGYSLPSQAGLSGYSLPSQAGLSGYSLPSQAGFSGYSLPSQAGLSGYSLPSQAGLSGYSLPSQAKAGPGFSSDRLSCYSWLFKYDHGLTGFSRLSQAELQEIARQQSSNSSGLTKAMMEDNPYNNEYNDFRLGKDGLYRYCGPKIQDKADGSAYLSTLIGGELLAPMQHQTVMELYNSDPDTYDFLLKDYMVRALSPLHKIFTEWLKKFSEWSYEIAFSVYIAMRRARKFLVIYGVDFAEIYMLSSEIAYQVEDCNNVADMAVVKSQIDELRGLAKSWVERTNW